MNVVYNSQDEIASNIVKILKKCGISRKTQLNIIYKNVRVNSKIKVTNYYDYGVIIKLHFSIPLFS